MSGTNRAAVGEREFIARVSAAQLTQTKELSGHVDALEGRSSAVWTREEALDAGLALPGDNLDPYPEMRRSADRLRSAFEGLQSLPKSASEAARLDPNALASRKASLIADCRAAVAGYNAALQDLNRSKGLG